MKAPARATKATAAPAASLPAAKDPGPAPVVEAAAPAGALSVVEAATPEKPLVAEPVAEAPTPPVEDEAPGGSAAPAKAAKAVKATKAPAKASAKTGAATTTAEVATGTPAPTGSASSPAPSGSAALSAAGAPATTDTPAPETAATAAATPAPAKRAPAKSAAKAPAPIDPADAWTSEELAEVRGELAGQAKELRGEIDDAETAAADLQQNAVGEGPGDEADAGSKTFEREHEMSLANNSRDLLLQVERALARVDDGTYGRCESCGNAIPKPRLQAFPRVTLCVSCKQREERR